MYDTTRLPPRGRATSTSMRVAATHCESGWRLNRCSIGVILSVRSQPEQSRQAVEDLRLGVPRSESRQGERQRFLRTSGSERLTYLGEGTKPRAPGCVGKTRQPTTIAEDFAMRQPGSRSGIWGGGNRTLDRRQPFILLVIAIFGLPLPVLAQATTAKDKIANTRMTDNACIADDFAAVSALIEDQAVRRGEITALGA